MSDRAPEFRAVLEDGEIAMDAFAGGGGTSTAMEDAFGFSPTIAINHSVEAIAMHAANHPNTEHFNESIFKVDPVKAVRGRKVGLAWFSPDCTHHSRAKGGKPVKNKMRGLAWVAVRWAHKVKPRVIILENVGEFRDWGPLVAGRPDPKRKGKTFRAFVRKLERLGYKVEHRMLRACDFGAPTSRLRFFLIARRDGLPITWPTPTHGPGLLPFRTAAECIDWTLPTRSIFDRKKALRPATLARIARGVKRYVLESAKPFIVHMTHHGERRTHDVEAPMPTVTGAHRGEMAVVSPSLIVASWGERDGQLPRVLDILRPLPTLPAGGIKQALVAAFLAKNFGGPNGHPTTGAQMDLPMPTVTAQDHHSLVVSHLSKFYGTSTGAEMTEPMPTVTAGGWKFAEVRAFLTAYFGSEKTGAQLTIPMRTVTTKDRFGLVTVEGVDYEISDICLRMLVARELFNAHGFPASYVINPIVRKTNKKGRILLVPMSKTWQVRCVGNSVPVQLASAIVRANFAQDARRKAA